MTQQNNLKSFLTNKLLKFDNIPIALLALAILPLPYVYYQIMRWVVCGFAINIILNHSKNNSWKGIFCFLAIIYNPINPLHLTKTSWVIVNIISAIVWILHEKISRVN